jgi:hypothetical protein
MSADVDDYNSRSKNDATSRFAAGLEGVEEDAFVFEAAPQPLDEDVVHPAAAPVHGDADAGVDPRAVSREGTQGRTI